MGRRGSGGPPPSSRQSSLIGPRRHCLALPPSVGGLGRQRGVAVLLVVPPQGGGVSLRAGRGLLCFDWTVGNHVIDALAEMALLRLRR